MVLEFLNIMQRGMTCNIVCMFQTMHLTSNILKCSAEKQDRARDSHVK